MPNEAYAGILPCCMNEQWLTRCLLQIVHTFHDSSSMLGNPNLREHMVHLIVDQCLSLDMNPRSLLAWIHSPKLWACLFLTCWYWLSTMYWCPSAFFSLNRWLNISLLVSWSLNTLPLLLAAEDFSRTWISLRIPHFPLGDPSVGHRRQRISLHTFLSPALIVHLFLLQVLRHSPQLPSHLPEFFLCSLLEVARSPFVPFDMPLPQIYWSFPCPIWSFVLLLQGWSLHTFQPTKILHDKTNKLQ